MPASNIRQKYFQSSALSRITGRNSLYGIALIGTLLSATSAFAQAASPSPEDIIVTGSRVIKNGNDSPSPTTIVSSQELLNIQPGQLNDALQVLPVFSGSRGSQSNPSSTGSSTGGNGAANVISLRGLGGQRTLPLLDGQRIPPTMFNGNVDVDLIPQMMVQRVDVVTGGVSAVYGSDAISGVVNYIMDKHYNGIKFQATQGVSSEGDGWKTDIGAAFGTNFAGGRGHFEASYEFRDEKGILYHSDRSWLAQAGVTGLGTTSNPFTLIQNTRLSNTAFGGLITSGVLTGQVFKTNGVLSPFVHGTATGVSTVEIGGDGGYYDGSLLSPLKSHQYFARLDYEVADNVKFYAEALGNFKRNRAYADYLTLSNVTISSTNAFLAPQYQAALAAAHQTTFKLSEIVSDGPREEPIEQSDQQVFKAGFSGKLGRYEWGIDGVYGITKMHTTLGNNVNYQHLAASLDAVTNASGQIVCRTAATSNPACVAFNPFGPTAANPAALAYIMQNTDWRGETEMPDITAHISGAPFSLPAGPVNMAVSGEWRKTSFSATTNSSAYAPVDCTGIANNCSTTTKLTDLSLSGFPKTSESVWELAYEFDAPIFHTSGGMGLNINGAVRYTDYEFSGRYVTWKAGGDFNITDTLRLRGTASRDIRAPNIFDLFAPPNPTINTTLDLLTGLSTTLQTGGGGGNPALVAEKGNTFTVGAVWKPRSNFSISVDYFHITINDAIAAVSGRDAASQNQCYLSGGSSPYCALQQRANGSVAAAIAAYNANPASVVGNPAYVAINWQSQNLNVAKQVTYGFDLEVNYTTHLFNRALGFRLLSAYQPHLYTYQPGLSTTDYAGVGWGPNGFSAVPKVSVTALAKYQLTHALTVDLMERWQSKLKISGVPTDVFAPGQGTVSSWATTNLTLTYERAVPWGKAATFLNIQNLFDKHPPVGAFTSNITRAGERDGFPVGESPMGLYFTVGIRVSH